MLWAWWFLRFGVGRLRPRSTRAVTRVQFNPLEMCGRMQRFAEGRSCSSWKIDESKRIPRTAAANARTTAAPMAASRAVRASRSIRCVRKKNSTGDVRQMPDGSPLTPCLAGIVTPIERGFERDLRLRISGRCDGDLFTAWR
jgi:hypothetical protein